MRWKSLDPMAWQFPDQSPYVAFNNNPVYYIDPLGLKGEKPGKVAKEKKWRSKRTKEKLDALAKSYGIDEYSIHIDQSGVSGSISFKGSDGVVNCLTFSKKSIKTNIRKINKSGASKKSAGLLFREKLEKGIKNSPIVQYEEQGNNITTTSDHKPIIPVYDNVDEGWHEDDSAPDTWSAEKEEQFQKWLREVGRNGGYAENDLNPTRKMTKRELREYWERAEAGGDDLFVESGTTTKDGSKRQRINKTAEVPQTYKPVYVVSTDTTVEMHTETYDNVKMNIYIFKIIIKKSNGDIISTEKKVITGEKGDTLMNSLNQ